jgi:tRNA (guanine6-N2)-methyltransferase
MGVGIGLIARAVRGIEYVVADEIAAEIATLAPASIALSAREVAFRADGRDPRLGALRTPDDVFLSVGSVGGVGHRRDAVPWLAEQAGLRDWRQAAEMAAELRQPPVQRRFDVVASLLGRRNYSRYDVEDEVGAALSAGLGWQYVSRRGHAGEVRPAEFTVRVLISGDRATFALRLADRPLHRRSYKQDATHGTLHPPMAAALARVLAAGAGEVVADPFCGDGTIPIEIAALAPGAEIHGFDRDPARVRNAVANAARAKAGISFSVADAGSLEFADAAVDVLVANPPWNLAVDAAGLLAGGFGPFWGEAERVMSPAGRMGIIMDAGFGTVDDLRQRGFEISLVQSVRLAGRLCEIVVCTPPGRPRWELPGGISRWRREAPAAGLVTGTGFEPRGH